MARVSKTPGRTRQLNFFVVDPERRLVDLPGYGYAEVPRAEKRRWGGLLAHYLRSRESLAALVLVADARRGVGAADLLLLHATRQAEVPVHLVLTKADKLSRREFRSVLLRARAQAPEDCAASLQLFSATRRHGVDELAERVGTWLSG